MSKKKTRVSASPKARKFARELGLDINLVSGSERESRVVETDIKKYVKEKSLQKTISQESNFKNEFPHSDFGEIETFSLEDLNYSTSRDYYKSGIKICKENGLLFSAGFECSIQSEIPFKLAPVVHPQLW